MSGPENSINNSGNQDGNLDANAKAWASLYDPIRKNIDDNLKDDKAHIQNKLDHKYGYNQEDANRELEERTKLHDDQVAEIDAYMAKLEQTKNRTEEEYNKQHQEDFVGERNYNDKQNKERTFTTYDVYPNIDPSPDQPFGERTRRRNDMTVLTEYLPMFPDEAADSYSKRVNQVYEDFPREDGEDLDHYKERIEKADKDNELLMSLAKHTIEPDSKIAESLQADLDDIAKMEQSGRYSKEQIDHFRHEQLEKAINEQYDANQKAAKEDKRNILREKLANKKQGLDDLAKKELEEKAKKELEEKAKIEAAQKKLIEDETRLKEVNEELYKTKQDRLDEIDKELGPLVAVNADFTHDKKELAHDFAEQALNAENAKSNLIKRIWKGNLFKKYYEKKYEREIMEGKRDVDVDGKKMSLEQVIKNRSDSAIERFTLAATDEYGREYIHDKAGEDMTEADKRTTEVVKSAVEKFAKARIPEDGDMDKLIRDFDNDIRELIAEGKDNGAPVNEAMINNYLDIAKQARMRAEHGIAMERVMDGFKVVNAEVRNNVRTEAHRDSIDKATNWLESTKVGSILPPEIIAGAVGTVAALTQTGVRAAAGVIGGIGVSSIAAGLRERNRVTEDRARMMRDAAINEVYNSGDDTRANRKRSKYEAKLGGTIYDIRPASELTSNLNEALESGNNEQILRAIAEARVRIDYSDSEQKDLICYSSADKMGDERTRLDIAVIRATHGLSEQERAKLKTMEETVQNEIVKNVEANDANFRKIRAAQALKQAGKTVLISSAFFLGSQEVMAALDPNKIGLLEKTGAFEKLGIKTPENTENATETLLAGLARPSVKTEVHTTEPIRLRGDQEVEAQRLEQLGYEKQLVSKGTTESTTEVVDIRPANSPNALRVNTTFADNGTKFADGNELGLHLENGHYVAKLSGNSTMGDQVFNYEQLANAGRIKGHITIGGGTFEMQSAVDASGNITWPIDASGNITTTTGETIRAFGENGEKLFRSIRVVADNGVDADGVRQVVSLAADAGTDSFNGTIQQVVDTVTRTPDIYEFVKTTVTETPITAPVSFSGGIVPPVFTSRVGLGEARATQNTANEARAPGETPSGANNTENPPADNEAPAQTETSSDNTTSTGQSADTAPTSNDNQEPAQSFQPTQPTPNQAPNSTVDQGNEGIRSAFLNLVGEDGVRFMTDTARLNQSYSDELGEWWKDLSEEARNEVIGFEEINRTANTGIALRAWLENQGILSQR